MNRLIEESFISYVFDNLLDDVICWINKNLSPEDVFEPNILEEWAKDNDYIYQGD